MRPTNESRMLDEVRRSLREAAGSDRGEPDLTVTVEETILGHGGIAADRVHFLVDLESGSYGALSAGDINDTEFDPEGLGDALVGLADFLQSRDGADLLHSGFAVETWADDPQAHGLVDGIVRVVEESWPGVEVELDTENPAPRRWVHTVRCWGGDDDE